MLLEAWLLTEEGLSSKKEALTNTGSILWRTKIEETNHVYYIIRDNMFMKRFGSDQRFLVTSATANEINVVLIGSIEGITYIDISI